MSVGLSPEAEGLVVIQVVRELKHLLEQGMLLTERELNRYESAKLQIIKNRLPESSQLRSPQAEGKL